MPVEKPPPPVEKGAGAAANDDGPVPNGAVAAPKGLALALALAPLGKPGITAAPKLVRGAAAAAAGAGAGAGGEENMVGAPNPGTGAGAAAAAPNALLTAVFDGATLTFDAGAVKLVLAPNGNAAAGAGAGAAGVRTGDAV